MTPDVKALGDDLAQRHRLDPNRKAASAFQAFNRIADDLTRTLADLEARNSTLLAQWRAEDEAIRLSRAKPVCAECGAKNLEHFYTSKLDGRVVCPDCFHSHNVHQNLRHQA